MGSSKANRRSSQSHPKQKILKSYRPSPEPYSYYRRPFELSPSDDGDNFSLSQLSHLLFCYSVTSFASNHFFNYVLVLLYLPVTSETGCDSKQYKESVSQMSQMSQLSQTHIDYLMRIFYILLIIVTGVTTVTAQNIRLEMP